MIDLLFENFLDIEEFLTNHTYFFITLQVKNKENLFPDRKYLLRGKTVTLT